MGVFGGLYQWLSSERPPAFECQHCGEGFDRQRQVCPTCGSGYIDHADVDVRSPNR